MDKQSTAPTKPHVAGRNALELSHLNLRFGSQIALEDISLQIEPGLRVAVVGPNGAGKSTLFNVLAGVLAPSAGEIKIHGHKPGEHLCLAYVTQSHQIDWNFPVSAWDVVMMGRAGKLGLLHSPKSADRDLVRRSLETVGLAGLAHRQIGELSGGQRQRLFIARALAQEADLLLLDEPLSGLDIPSQEQILKILDELKNSTVTVLFATHDLELAAEHFDRILLLNRGLIAYGTRQQVLTAKNLEAAYGGHMQVLETGEGRIVIGDSGGHHGHDAEGRHG